MGFLIGLLRFGIGLGTLAVSFLAVVALLGFASPVADLFNHAQLLLFLGTLAGLALVVLLFRRGRWRRWVAAAAGVGLAASAATFLPEVAYGLMPRPPLPPDERPVLKLMTHNLFGLNYEMERVAGLVEAEDPDVIVLQEFFPDQSRGLHPLLADAYPHVVQCRGGKRANLGLYSKQPFEVDSGTTSCPDDASGTQRTARITAHFSLADGSGLAVMTTHLDWPVPVGRQVAQFEELRAAVAAVDGPLILAGDFNSTPWSYALRGFSERAGLERYTRNLVSFPNRFMIRRMFETLPFLPLDHVLGRSIAVHEVHTGPDTGSDHLPVFASFSLDPSR